MSQAVQQNSSFRFESKDRQHFRTRWVFHVTWCSSRLRMRLLLLLLLFLLHVFNGSWHPSCCITAILWSSISLIDHHNILFARPVEVRNLKTSFFLPNFSIQLKMSDSPPLYHFHFLNPAIIRFLSSLYCLHITSTLFPARDNAHLGVAPQSVVHCLSCCAWFLTLLLLPAPSCYFPSPQWVDPPLYWKNMPPLDLIPSVLQLLIFHTILSPSGTDHLISLSTVLLLTASFC